MIYLFRYLAICCFGILLNLTALAQDTITVQIDEKTKVLIFTQDREALSQLKTLDLNQIIAQVLADLGEDLEAGPQEKTYEFAFDAQGVARLENEEPADTDTDKAGAYVKSVHLKIPPGKVVTEVYSGDSVYVTKATLSNLFGKNVVQTNKVHVRAYHNPRWRTFGYISLGLNNFLEDGGFPDATGAPYGLMVGRSLFFNLGTYQRLRLSPKGNFSLYTGLELERMTFRFQGSNFLTVSDQMTVFRNYREDFGESLSRSRMGIWYLNIPLMMQFKSGKKANKFMMGLGGYAGLRLGANTFIRETDSGVRIRNRDSFMTNTLRYGLEAQIGFDDSLFFLRYDLNTLFSEGRGPELNLLTMGIRCEL